MIFMQDRHRLFVMMIKFFSDYLITFLFLFMLRNLMELDNATIKRLKGIGHDLKPVVMIGNNGVTPAIIEEINRALNDHELIKVKLPAGSKHDRDLVCTELASAAKASLIHTIGRMALLLRQNPNANPKLSNLARHAE